MTKWGNVKDEDAEEELLVKEVLSEFPPDERGERQEWNQHVGWHRRENIRGEPFREEDIAASKHIQNAGLMNDVGAKDNYDQRLRLKTKDQQFGPATTQPSSPNVVHYAVFISVILLGLGMLALLGNKQKRRKV